MAAASSSSRSDRVLQSFDDLGVDTLVVTSGENLRYLSGFRGGEGAILLSKDRKLLMTDSRYLEAAEMEAPDWETERWERASDESLMEQASASGKRVGIEARNVPVARLRRWESSSNGATIVETEQVVEKVRAIKDPSEVEAISKACRIADEVLAEALASIGVGMTEAELALELDLQMQRHGAEKPSFETIVAFGARSSLPHAVAGERALTRGDIILIDFGAQVDGYHSDMTRVFFCGETSDEQLALYESVRAAQQAAMEAAQIGMDASALDAVARRMLTEAGHGDHFGHGLGHGVGLEVHEHPALSPAGRVSLKENMVFTIEPGAYIPGFGGVRIEDTVVLTDDGVVALTASPKEVTVI